MWWIVFLIFIGLIYASGEKTHKWLYTKFKQTYLEPDKTEPTKPTDPTKPETPKQTIIQEPKGYDPTEFPFQTISYR